MKYKLKLQPKVVIIISIIIGIVMITSAYFELKSSKDEVYKILSEDSSSLIETISLSSINTLNSSYELEKLVVERLLNNARLLKSLDSMHILTKAKLIEIGKENKLFRINIFNNKGDRILSNRVPLPGHIHPEGPVNRFDEIKPILTGRTDEMVIGLKEAEFSKEKRFAVAVARSNNRGAIVINLDAKDFLEFRKKIGIGKIIRDIADNSGIEYVVLQDTAGVLAASESVKSMNSIEGDPFLEKALNTDSIYTRNELFEGQDVFEVVKRLKINNDVIGLYRIGLKLDEVQNIEARMYRRIIIISLLLAAISVIVLSIVFTSENLKSVSSEFSKFKTFTGTVLENMGEAVIVFDKNFIITLFNNAAENLFETKREKVINEGLTGIINGKLAFIKEKVLDEKNNITEIENIIEINGRKLYLSFSTTINKNELNEVENYILVISNFTERKNLEEHAKRQEKLSAMGKLASGVAHEIRNPINAIGMIAQRLNKEFNPTGDETEYRNITQILRNEVNRINKIITQFLNYAKPLELSLKEIDAKDYFGEIYYLFNEQAKLKKIEFVNSSSQSFKAKIDPELMKQSLMNIIQNALDAVGEGGRVEFNYYKSESFILIEVKDNGIGMNEETIKKIFDLYYTTKNEGNGLGLSISQKIISQHSGTISVESKLNEGTKFTIKLPEL